MILACSGNTAYGFEAIRGDNIDDRTPQTLGVVSLRVSPTASTSALPSRVPLVFT